MVLATYGYGISDKFGTIEKVKFYLKDVDSHEILVHIFFCGLCQTDVNLCHCLWGKALSKYPMIPGHEIIGVIKSMGDDVTKFKLGDIVGIGFIVDSCGECSFCQNNLPMFCSRGFVSTFSSVNCHGDITQGGLAHDIVVSQNFAIRIPPTTELHKLPPLICAGAAVWCPLVKYVSTDATEMKKKIGIIGLGGLGHIAVKIAAAMKYHVTVISRTEKKAQDSKVLGAHNFISMTNPDMMARFSESLDLIIDTGSGAKDLEPYMKLLKSEGVICLLGLPPAGTMYSVSAAVLLRKKITGSFCASVEDIEAMLKFCDEKQISCDCELVKPDYINEAVSRIEKEEVHFRFVVDLRDDDAESMSSRQ